MASIVFAFFQIFENLNISKIIYQLSEKCFSYFWNFCENLLLKIWKTNGSLSNFPKIGKGIDEFSIFELS